VRKERAKRTKLFVEKKGLDRVLGWRGRLGRFGERLFGGRRLGGQTARRRRHSDASEPVGLEGERREFKMKNLGDIESARGERRDGDRDRDREAESFFDAYNYSIRSRSLVPSNLPSLDGRVEVSKRGKVEKRYRQHPDYDADSEHRISRTSLYSEMTGEPRRGPEPRQPVKFMDGIKTKKSTEGNRLKSTTLLGSRFSASTIVSTIGSSKFPPAVPEGELIPVPPLPTEAQVYADRVKPRLLGSGGGGLNGERGLEPSHTGGSLTTNESGLSSRNPFKHLVQG